MNKTLKIIKYLLITLVAVVALLYLFFNIKWKIVSSTNMKLVGDPAPTLTINDISFRDLNKNGNLDDYEDARLSIESRINDLIGQMNKEEKAALLFITIIGMKNDGRLMESPILSEPLSFFINTNSHLVAKLKMNHFNVVQSPSAKAMAIWNNNIQKLAERTRLGIPVTIATDPRHMAAGDMGANVPTPFFSKWCSPLGFAAIGDTMLMREFGNIARQEYLALGMRLALSPMADLATEPRWGRIGGTFGEDAKLSAQMTKAYVLGFQGDSLNQHSVACMTKHFSGAGPQKDGEDAHFPYGADQVYPGDNFDYHVIPFVEGALPARTAQIMPYYGIPLGQTPEDVAMGFNKYIITDLLRDSLGFEGVVCTDWGLVSNSKFKPAAAWGVEHLSEIERAQKILDAGCDMFGGEYKPNLIIELMKTGQVKESRIDQSVRRVLRDKFRLGLFDNPYVDPKKLEIIGFSAFIEKGIGSQRRSLTLLKNRNNLLPLSSDTKVYLEGFSKYIKNRAIKIVGDIESADVIIKKLKTPYTPRNKYLIERFFRQGRLDFLIEEKSKILNLISKKPTIIVFNMERPPIFPEINEVASAVIADFNSSDKVIIELIVGKFQPSGKLPFEIPSSVAAVENQLEDMPYDSESPLYPFGHGLTYEDNDLNN